MVWVRIIFLPGSAHGLNRGLVPLLLLFLSILSLYTHAQRTPSRVWIADNGDGTYKNPVIHADYSDPDAVRVGDDYYMTSSSFNHIPGLPILHSKDLVNWTLIGYALKRQSPFEHFEKVQHGGGVWAPSIRYHNNEFYIYYPDPDFGIYLVKAKNINGPWTDPVLVEAGKGLIDPCPLWDTDGKVYLVHAFAGSRAGIKSIIVVKELNKEGTKITGDPVLVYDGHELDPTIEGPKFYKRNDYYYIFAPAGGVSTGWQTVLRSKNIYGPYERKVVMDQGSTPINGPHQGAWVETKTGEHWFLHFQDKEAYGRVVHLQPMKWVHDWPVIGTDKDGDGKGEPVLMHKKPNVGKSHPLATPPDSDEFNSSRPGSQWQWQANHQGNWALITSVGSLRMISVYKPALVKNSWDFPNILAQKIPADEFTATVKLRFTPRSDQDRFGFIIFGSDYACLQIQKKEGSFQIAYIECRGADKESAEIEKDSRKLTAGDIYLQIQVNKGAVCRFNFSTDGNHFEPIGGSFTAKPGRWVGAKIGFYCSSTFKTNDAGFADIDWFHIEKIQ